MLVLDLETTFPFYRCLGCGKLLSRLDEIGAMKTGQICPCGYNEYSPTNLTLLDHLKPTFWRMFILYLKGEVSWPTSALSKS